MPPPLDLTPKPDKTLIQQPLRADFRIGLRFSTFPNIRAFGTKRIGPDSQSLFMEPYVDVCMDKLFHGAGNFRIQQALAEEFGYPSTDADGYFGWRKLGGTGLKPKEWCRHYARQKTSSGYSVRMSLR